MNLRSFFSLIIFAAAATLTGCYTPKEKSATTGWNINDPKWGGYQVLPTYEQPTPPGMVFIEGGSFLMGASQEDLNYDYNMIPRRVTVSSFYMSETEVRNMDYNEYLHWLQRIYGNDYPEVVRRAEPDELCLRNVRAYMEDLVENYFRHPAYNEYPVVGVSWVQANDYCKWLTDRVNERILIDMGFQELNPAQTSGEHFNTDAYLTGQYEGIPKRGIHDMDPTDPKKTRAVQLKDGILMSKFRLPTEAEWEYAAYGLKGNTYDERVVERKVYPWGGSSVRSNDPKHLGEMRANFMRGRGDNMGVAGNLNDGGDYAVEVRSYTPNDFGLYNMAGNVSEWTLDVYRPLTFEDAEATNPFRGNEYRTFVRDEYGEIAQKDSLGRVPTRPVTPEEVANRRNYQKADNRNYSDGDFASAIRDNWENSGEEQAATTEAVYDVQSSLITDNSRVIKGGSYRDRAYWMSPGTRRFLDQDRAEPWVGFRYAVSRVGSQAKRTR